MQLETDLPYLEPLLFHIRDDVGLKKHFTEKSFFMPTDSLVAAFNDVAAKKCPSPRTIWIMPQDGIVQTQNNFDCDGPVVHTFNILIIVHCIRDEFRLSFDDETKKTHLVGEYMELAHIRKLVRKSVRDFNRKNNASPANKKFEKLRLIKYSSLYPDKKNPFIVQNLEYNVNIF